MLRVSPSFLVWFGLIVMTGPVAAGVITLDAIDSGWYSQFGFHDAANKNYLAGLCCGLGEHRDYFVFPLAGVPGTITGATLRLSNPGVNINGFGGYGSPDPTETYVVYDVSTPVLSLMM